MQKSRLDPDGLHLPVQLTPAQLADDDVVRTFAAELLTSAMHHTHFSKTLAEALHHTGSETYPLLAALLVLDAELEALIDGEHRVFPLPGFLTYRAGLPLDKFPLSSVRLPPLNPDGHFFFVPAAGQSYLALRLDLHPVQKVMGHVRLALSRPGQLPKRLHAVEHLLDRRILSEVIIRRALAAAEKDLTGPMTPAEQEEIGRILGGLHRK